MTPAAPARIEPIRNVATITRSTSIPIIAAASRSYAVARIAFPSVVRPTSSVSAIISENAATTTRIRVVEIRTPATSMPPLMNWNVP